MSGNEIETEEIVRNLDFLTRHTGNLNEVTIRLIESQIISLNESQIIESEKTDLSRNLKLYTIILTKGWQQIRDIFLKILCETGNSFCADKIKGIPIPPKIARRGILKSVWWPDTKYLPKSFYERKSESNPLVVNLQKILSTNDNGMTVINQKVAVSGLGGIGKTTTAKWFANYFQENYDHIIWVDCGEGSLLKSFKNLARDLKLENRHELDLSEMAARSFEILKGLNCLWIYDNAECYVGIEGIRNVLPQNLKNFHAIITSRSREWGNETGDGKIPEFPMDVFEKHEGVDFLKQYVRVFTEGDEWKLEKLCELLGHLPLALQIAIATLNQKKISLNDYIERLTKSDLLLHRNFDDYEKTINKTMKISLDLIKGQEGHCGNLAYKILILLGYVIPDDVESEFLACVENEINATISEAAELLENYSLVSLTKFEANELFTLSIHRLLQQVIRHNGKMCEDETLRKIMTCKGCWNYKLIPYCYANENLQHEFLKTRKEIMSKVYLKELLQERRYQEAVELSRLKKNENSNHVTTYNYAWCLYHHSETNEATRLLEDLLNQDIDFPTKTIYGDAFNEAGIIGPNKDLTKEIIAGQLFTIYLNDKTKLENTKTILKSRRLILPIVDQSSLQNLIFCLENFSILDYTIQFYGSSHFMSVEVCEESFGKHLQIYECSFEKHRPLNLSSIKKISLHQVKLFVTNITADSVFIVNSKLTFTGASHISARKLSIRNTDMEYKGNEKCDLQNADILKIFDISKIEKLEINGTETVLDDIVSAITPYNDFNDKLQLLSKVIKAVSLTQLPDYTISLNSKLLSLAIAMNDNSPGKTIQLSDCSLVESVKLPVDLQCLKLHSINFSRKLSELLDLSQLKNIEICYSKKIELAGTVITADSLYLRNVEILDWSSINGWMIEKVSFINIPVLNKFDAQIGEIIIEWSPVDLSIIPQTTKKLTCRNTTFVNFPRNNLIGPITAPCNNLRELTLENVRFEDMGDDEELDDCCVVSSIIPTGLKKLKLRKCTISSSMMDQIENLHFSHTNIVLDSDLHVAPKYLTLYNVNVYKDGEEFQCRANHFIDFSKMEILDLKSLTIDFSEPFHVPEVTLYYYEAEWDWVEAIDWSNAKWNVDKFTICGNGSNPFVEKNQMAAKELRMTKCDVDFSKLPSTTENLSLYNSRVVNFSAVPTKKFLYPCKLKELSLIDVKFIQDNQGNPITAAVDISSLIPQSLRKLIVDFPNSSVIVTLHSLSLIENLDLRNCSLLLERNIRRIKPIELKLHNVKCLLRHDVQNFKVINVDEFVDFRRIKNVYLQRMSINMNQPVTVELLTLQDARVVDWKNGKWCLNLLRTWQITDKTEMKIDRIQIMTQADANFTNRMDWFGDALSSDRL